MTTWKRLTVKLTEEEFNELEKIRKRHRLSYNKLIRAGIQTYVMFVIGKEELMNTKFLKTMKSKKCFSCGSLVETQC